MAMHLERAIAKLKKHLLVLSAKVEETVRDAVKSIESRDSELAQRVIDADGEIDQSEVDIEEECLKLLALYQPVAIDLRVIITVLKVNDALESIGDEAVNISERSLYLSSQKAVGVYLDFPGMAQKAQTMLAQSLDAFVERDSQLARRVCIADDEVDDINRDIYEKVKRGILENPQEVDTYIHQLGVSRNLERIADLAVNIAEDVVYLVEGEIIRHKTKEFAQEERDA